MTRNPKLKQSIPTVTDAIPTVSDAKPVATEVKIGADVPPMAANEPMRLICPRKELIGALKRINGIAPKRSTMPMLSNVAIRASKTGVVFAVTDLNTYGIVEIGPTWVHSPGSATVNMKALLDTLGKLGGDKVTIAAKMHSIEITCGTATVSLAGLPARDYPKLPAVLLDDAVVLWSKISAPDLRETLAAVEFAICKDETRFHLNGVLMEYDGETLRCVATDGHRLAKAQRTVTRQGDFATKGSIIPAAAVKHLHRLLGRGECEVMLGKVGTSMPDMFVVKFGNTTIATKLIDAQFPPYEQVIPKDNRRLMTVDKAALKSALERAKLACSETRGVRLEMQGETLVLASDNPDTGETRETLPAECSKHDEKFVLGCNPRYLIDALGEIDDERVTLAFDHSEKRVSKRGEYQPDPALSPFTVRSTTDAVSFRVAESALLCVVMPMRV